MLWVAQIFVPHHIEDTTNSALRDCFVHVTLKLLSCQVSREVCLQDHLVVFIEGVNTPLVLAIVKEVEGRLEGGESVIRGQLVRSSRRAHISVCSSAGDERLNWVQAAVVLDRIVVLWWGWRTEQRVAGALQKTICVALRAVPHQPR